MTCFPIEDKEKKKVSHPAVSRMLFLIGAVFFVSMAVIGSANATNTVNWSEITAMVDGVAGLMPSISGLVIAIVPTLLLLIVVGFLTGIFDGIIGGITAAFGRLGR